MKKLRFLFICTVLLGMISCKEDYPDLKDGMYAEFNTSKGTFLARLNYKTTPITVANFVALAEGNHSMVDSLHKGKKFYDGLIFHRVIKDFMIQGGDPTGTGSGDPGYKFPDEIVDSLQFDKKGILAMANAGPNTNGSQFFITLKETPWLNGKYTIFGEVVKGQEVVDSIGTVKTGPGDKPVVDVKINNVNIIRKGKEAKDFDANKIFEDKLADVKKEQEEMSQRQAAAKEDAKQKFASFKEDAKKLESGLQIYYIKKGEGPQPKTGDIVKVDYAGYFQDGTLFDTSMEDLAVKSGAFSQQRKDQIGYVPMEMPYGPDAKVIPGFKEGLQQMKVGDKVVLYIPSHLAYGERGAGGVIPPNTDLIFQIEMLGIKE